MYFVFGQGYVVSINSVFPVFLIKIVHVLFSVVSELGSDVCVWLVTMCVLGVRVRITA